MPKIRIPGTRPEKNTAEDQRQSITAPAIGKALVVHGRPIEKGQVLNPLGRPIGSRNKLTEAFLKDLHEIWEEGGIEMLRYLGKNDPRSIVAACVALVPKSIEVDATQRIYQVRETPLTPDEWAAKHSGGVPIPKQSETAH